MKILHIILTVVAFLYTDILHAQTDEIQNATTYKTNLFGSVASGSNTPFWMVSNRYGIVPLDADNGYLSAGVFHQQHFGKGFRWNAGLELAGAVPRYRNIYIYNRFMPSWDIKVCC